MIAALTMLHIIASTWWPHSITPHLTLLQQIFTHRGLLKHSLRWQ